MRNRLSVRGAIARGRTSMYKASRKVQVVALAISGLVLLLPAQFPIRARARQTPVVRGCVTAGKISNEGFRSVMETIAEGWNHGDAKLAASCFAEDAIYLGPPSPARRGRQALYEFFGGSRGREDPMHMTWHNLVFDPAQQVGVGEYTFRYRTQTHGLVIVRISNGLIRNWQNMRSNQTCHGASSLQTTNFEIFWSLPTRRSFPLLLA
jgi:hypothetical protein